MSAAAMKCLRGLSRTFSTARVAALADRGLREADVLAAAQSLGLRTFPRAGVLWVLLSARRRARDEGGDR